MNKYVYIIHLDLKTPEKIGSRVVQNKSDLESKIIRPEKM